MRNVCCVIGNHLDNYLSSNKASCVVSYANSIGRRSQHGTRRHQCWGLKRALYSNRRNSHSKRRKWGFYLESKCSRSSVLFAVVGDCDRTTHADVRRCVHRDARSADIVIRSHVVCTRECVQARRQQCAFVRRCECGGDRAAREIEHASL
jgi:hypothetical protein